MPLVLHKTYDYNIKNTYAPAHGTLHAIHGHVVDDGNSMEAVPTGQLPYAEVWPSRDKAFGAHILKAGHAGLVKLVHGDGTASLIFWRQGLHGAQPHDHFLCAPCTMCILLQLGLCSCGGRGVLVLKKPGTHAGDDTCFRPCQVRCNTGVKNGWEEQMLDHLVPVLCIMVILLLLLGTAADVLHT